MTAARKAAVFVDTDELRAMLRTRYAAPEYALFDEVASGTGAASTRRCDGVAMSLWPSRGLEVIGFELKVSRHDWLRELKNPKKADELHSFCDRWVLVVGDAEIVKPGELPPTWGLLLAQGGKLVMKVEPPKLEPKPLERSFVAAVLRRAHEANETIRTSALRAGVKQGIEQGPDQHKRDMHRVETERDELTKSIADFQKVSGIEIGRWNGGDLGALVKMVQTERQRHYRNAEDPYDPSDRLRLARDRLAQLVEDLEKDIEVESRIRVAMVGKERSA